MPLTFLAHQGPLLPIARRWPNAVDGLALMIASMAPDLTYVLVGTRFEVRSHELPAALVVCVPLALVIVWLVARVLAPVVPDHVPQLDARNTFDFASYRGLATHQTGVIRSVLWASAGSLSHVGIDQFTHDWGWAARHFPWFGQPLGGAQFAGRGWSPARIAQYTGHVGFTLLAVFLLASYARSGWFRARADTVARFPVTAISQLVVWGFTGFGIVIAGAIGSLNNPSWVVVFMRCVGGAFVGMCVGAAILKPR